jgi:hypothetical protein
MAQKYIKDDIVMYKNRIHTIIDTLGLNNYELSYVRHSVNQAELSGIPLTLEILEKNGWVKDTHRHCLDEMPAEAYGKKDFPLSYFNVTFGKTRIQASHDCLFVRNLKYVSDLQHLLFGLGLNSEMEV